MSIQSFHKKILSFVVVLSSVCLTLLAAEGLIRLKNASMQNYDIEMWKYALKLKQPSQNPLIGHEHIPNQSAMLQSVTIRTNEYGLRGEPIHSQAQAPRRILFLGSSVTLGWGVQEDLTVTQRLQQMFDSAHQPVEILNAGIGNFNTQRYVELFFTKLHTLDPTDIVVHYVMRDAETLLPSKQNFILRHSQLATTTWIVISRFLSKFNEPSLENHYHTVYEPTSPGYQDMEKQLTKLSQYCQSNNIRLYFAMTPDIHDLVDYQYKDIHEKMKHLATTLGFTYIDLLPALQGLQPEDIWAMPGDPHPNAYGHEKMATALYPVLANAEL
jgi:lysophospholipase L1-like esterase